MVVGERGDLGQVRHAQHLAARAERLQQAAHGRRDGAADAGVHLVEHERRDVRDVARRDLDRESDAGKLAARCDARERSDRLLRVRGDPELDRVEAVARGVGQRLERDLEPPPRHGERAHRGGHAVLEFRSRVAALRAELGGDRLVRVPRFACAALERFDVRRRGELGDRRFGRRQELRQRLGPHAVPARGVVQRREPLVDAREVAGIEVEAAAVVAQRPRGFLELDTRGIDQRHDLGERRIVRGGGREPGGDLRDAPRQRLVRFLERVGGLRARVDQRRGVREPRLRGAELRPLALAHRERGELVPARLEDLALGGRPASVDPGRVASLARRTPLPPRVAGLLRQRRESAERVDELALRLRGRERLVRVLAGDLDQPLAERLQLRERRGRAVDPRAASALRIEHAAQEDLAVAFGEPLLGQPRAHRRRVVDVERGRELGALGAGADLARLEADAEQEAERVEQDRLARAGLAGERREAGLELELEGAHDDEIADRQQPQHLQSAPRPLSRSGVSLQCSFSRSIAK